MVSGQEGEEPSKIVKNLQWEHIPEVEFEEAWEGKVPGRSSEPEPSCSFPVVALEWVNPFRFGPQVNHLPCRVGEGV